MNVEDTALIQLVLGLAKTKTFTELREVFVPEVKKQVEEKQAHIEEATIPVSTLVVARLSGPQFQIAKITDPKEGGQPISEREVTKWIWEIKPTKRGKHRLHLTLTALFTVNGTSTSRGIDTFDKWIDVEVTLGQDALMFLKQNWQWLWAAVLLPFVGWLWKKRTKFRRETTGK